MGSSAYARAFCAICDPEPAGEIYDRAVAKGFGGVYTCGNDRGNTVGQSIR